MQQRLRWGLVVVAALVLVAVPLTAQGGTFTGFNGPIGYDCGSSICVVNPDGTNPHSLITNASDITWSSDQSEIVYVSGNDLVVADPDGSFPATLPTGADAVRPARQPTLNLNDDLVAYTQTGDIFTINTDTTEGPTNLTNTATTIESDPAWSPDGTQIAYVANGQVRILNNLTSATPTSRAVTSSATNAQDPTWSPKGDFIVYSDGGQLFRISTSATSGAGTAIANGTQPVYSPDATKVAFVNNAGNLAVVSATGGSATQLGSGIPAANLDWEAVDSSSGPPTNTSYPTINLLSTDTQPVVGHFLTASIGSWDGAFPISYTYQWKRCDPSDTVNGPCVNIVGATSSFYTPTNDDVGKRLRVQVTATNGQGSASQNSEVSGIVIAIAPHVRVTPQIDQLTPVVDTPLNVGAGFWDGSAPVTFTYSWRRCDPVGDLDSCVQIPGSSSTTAYTPTTADIGFSIRVWITGTNPQGSDVAITNHTYPVVDKPHFAPSATTPPTVGGTPAIGRQLTANIGDYDGDAPIKTVFTWQRCDATGAACKVITAAKQKIVYTPTTSDIGFTILIQVVSTNAYGELTSKSDPTEPVAMPRPNQKGKHIVGTNKADYLAGTGNDDTIEGLGGNDTILGGAGDDKIDGGAGNDVINGGAGADTIDGGPGSDTIYAADGERDTIDCGPGNDRVVADPVDKTVNCEVVTFATPGSSSGSGGSGPGGSGSGGSGSGGFNSPPSPKR